MPSPPEADFPADPHAIAVYMAAMAASMAKLSRQNGFDALAYLLELARLEAETIRQQLRPTRATGTED